MKQLLLLLAVSGVLASVPALAGDTYCIYLRSHVTNEEKVHSCRFFNSYKECQDAAEPIGGYCGSPK